MGALKSFYSYLSVRRVTRDERHRRMDRHWATIIALLPALASGWLAFGHRVLIALAVAAAAAFLTDTAAAVHNIRQSDRTPFRVLLCAAGQTFLAHWLLAALLIALALPPDAPLWLFALAGAIAGAAGRFAERGRFIRVASPALLALVIVYSIPGTGLIRTGGRILVNRRLISPQKALAAIDSQTDGDAQRLRAMDLLDPDNLDADITGIVKTDAEYQRMLMDADPALATVDAVTRATPLTAYRALGRKATETNEATAERYPPKACFFGYIPGTIGETNKLALLFGMVILIVSGYLPIRLALFLPAAVVVFSVPFLYGVLPWSSRASSSVNMDGLLIQVAAGGVFLSLFFFASPDYRPRSGFGQMLFALLLGALIALGRGLFRVDVTIYALCVCAALWPVIDIWAIRFSGESTAIIVSSDDDDETAPTSRTDDIKHLQLRIGASDPSSRPVFSDKPPKPLKPPTDIALPPPPLPPPPPPAGSNPS